MSGTTIISVTIFSFMSHHRLVETVSKSAASRQLISEVEEVQWHLRKAESDKRGFLLVSTENLLQSFETSLFELDQSTTHLKKYHDTRLIRINDLLGERKKYLGNPGMLKKGIHELGIKNHEQIEKVFQLSNEIEKLSNEVILENKVLVTENEKHIHELENSRFVLDVISSLLVLIMITIELIMVTRSNRAMIKSESDALKAKQRAEAASKHKSEFLSHMSHEIRTPLHGVLGMTQLLASTTLDKQQTDYVEAISISGQNLLLIINDILDFSKIEAGKVELEKNEFDLSLYASEICKPFIYSAEKKGIQFEVDFPELPFMIYSDSTVIGQIMLNLISNAFKFTSAGKVATRYRYRDDSSGKVFLRFETSDTGIGIPEKARERMFKAFSQASASTSRNFGGTGLGLSICKGLVNLLGGKIGFDSIPNVGTTFWFEIEAKRGSIRLPNFGRKLQNKAERKIQWAEGKRILIAEDNQINQRVLSEFLKRAGLMHHIVNNGNEVLNSLRESHFDLILMDCQMPELDGYETSKVIRESKDPRFSEIPIVAVTANAAKSDTEKCKEAGMNEYLTKPIDIKSLYECLAKYLKAESIDQSTIQDLTELESEGDSGLLLELIEIFLKTSPEKIEKIDALISEGKLKEAGKAAHSLKSSANTLGAKQLAKLCQEFEDLASSSLTKEAALTFAETLRQEFENAKIEFLKMQKELSLKAA